MVNGEKLVRAIEGSQNSLGEIRGGVGADAPEGAILAEYDRLGGLVKKGKYKVKTGSFYDFAKKQPRMETVTKKDKEGKVTSSEKVFAPNVKLVFRLNGEDVELDGNQEVPLEIQAAEQQKETKLATAAAKRAATAKKKKEEAAKKKKKNALEDESDEEDSDEEESDEEKVEAEEGADTEEE